MDENIIKLTLIRLANLLFLSVEELESMLKKHQVNEIRQRDFFWVPFLWVCFKCLLNGKTRHIDRMGLYKEIFKISLTGNAFSDRLSQLPPAFCKKLLERIQPHLNKIGSPKRRQQIKDLIYTIAAEDASIFHLDNRLVDIFKNIPGCNSVGLKLYANVNIVGETHIGATIKHVRTSDVKHKSRKPKNRKNKKTIELRDRGWFSIPLFVEWVIAGRYFISRIKSGFNPQVVKVIQGDSNWVRKKLKDIDLEGHDEIDVMVKPYRGSSSSGKVYRLKDNSVFTLRLKGKKGRDGVWFWYLFHLPNVPELTFNDVHTLYRARWRIEELFRELKQAMGGDRLRLRHPSCVVNHILMMVIAYLICKGYLNKIALAHRKSPSGFAMDICMTGSLRELFKKAIFFLVDNPTLSKKRLKEFSKAFYESGYSSKRARSYWKICLGMTLKKLKEAENGLS